jgi:hypothetical protein
MTRQFWTIDTPAKIGAVNSARALSRLERMAGFVRESARIARATASIAMAAGHGWQFPAHVSFLKYDQRLETESPANRQTHPDGSQSGMNDNPGRNGRNGGRNTASAAQLIRPFAAGAKALRATARVAHGIRGNEVATAMARVKDSDGASDGELRGRPGGRANAWHRTAAKVDAGGRLPREIQQLSLAAGALPRVERSLESGSSAWASFTAARRATESGLKSSSGFAERAHHAIKVAQTMVVAATESSPRSDAGRVSSRSRGSLEAERAASAGAGFLASARTASSIRAVIPPANLSQREFAEPPGKARGPNNSSVRTGITINSSPTVVINGPAAGGNVERDALGALRAHREELFNQLKRESARRERAQF